MEISEQRRDRRSFLRHVGTTLGVGIGIIALPAVAQGRQQQHAHPDVLYQCCYSPGGCPVDPGFTCANQLLYYCECPAGGSYCVCQGPGTPNCYNAPC